MTTRKKLLTAVLAPVLFIGLLEVVLRLAGFSYDPVAEGSVPTPHREWEQIDLYQQDPDLLWTLKPDTRLDDVGRGFVEVRTNAAGLRGPALPATRDPGELRVLCLGDSITFGLALTEEQAYTAHLERQLAAGPLGRGRRVRVISGAVPGWSAVQGLRLLDRLKGVDPDVVVFWFGMNDAQPARVLPDARLGRSDRTLERATSLLSSLRTFQLVQWSLHSVMGGIEEPRRVSPEEFGEVVAELRRREQAGGPRVIFVGCPNILDLAIEQLERIIARAEEEGVSKVYGPFPLLSPLRAAPPDTDLVGRREVIDGETVLVFSPEHVDTISEVRTLKGNLPALKRIRESLTLSLSTLPADRVDPAALFGQPPRTEFFIDTCHLSPLGARLAGESLARIIETRLR